MQTVQGAPATKVLRCQRVCSEWHVTDDGFRAGETGNVDGNLAEDVAVRVELLDAAVAAAGDVDVVVGVDAYRW